MTAAGHLSPEEAAAFARGDGTLSPAERLAVSDHAAACAACRSLVVDARCAAGAPPDLVRAFAGLVEAGRQEENPAPENWAGGEEFTSSLPALTPAEREETRALEARMATFEAGRFAPGGTLGAARETGRREALAEHGVGRDAVGGWRQRLFSWPGLGFAGAAAVVIVLAATIAWPRPQKPASGPRMTGGMRNPRPRFEVLDGPISVTEGGMISGVESIPKDLSTAVCQTIWRGAAPGALLGKLTRGGPGASASPSTSDPVDPLAAAPLSPVGTSVETDQPVFRWKAPAVPTAVEIIVRPSAGGDAVRSLPLAAGTVEWTPPAPLPRGALYRWQILPVSPDGGELDPSINHKPGMVFKVVSADTHARLEALRLGPPGQSHLILGVAYAREGLREDSAREFRALKANNAQSSLAQRLVDSLEGRGG